MKLFELLQAPWGTQETAVRAFATGSDVFLSIPLGGGKSLCDAVLPRVFDMLRGQRPVFYLGFLVWGGSCEVC